MQLGVRLSIDKEHRSREESPRAGLTFFETRRAEGSPPRDFGRTSGYILGSRVRVQWIENTVSDHHPGNLVAPVLQV